MRSAIRPGVYRSPHSDGGVSSTFLRHDRSACLLFAAQCERQRGEPWPARRCSASGTYRRWAAVAPDWVWSKLLMRCVLLASGARRGAGHDAEVKMAELLADRLTSSNKRTRATAFTEVRAASRARSHSAAAVPTVALRGCGASTMAGAARRQGGEAQALRAPGPHQAT